MKRIKNFIVFFAILMCFNAVELYAATNVEEAWDAIKRNDYVDALTLFNDLANQGNPEGQYGLGYMYSRGLGVNKDLEESIKFYQQAAKAGHLVAIVNLGYAYDFALGVPRDQKQAEYWYQQAANRGDYTGMNNLAYSWVQSDRNLEQAYDLIVKVLAHNPDNVSALDTYGWILYKLARYEESVPPLCQAALGEPGNPEIRLHLGDAYWQVGLPDQARQEWQQALDLHKGQQFLSENGSNYLGVQQTLDWENNIHNKIANGIEGTPPLKTDPARFANKCLRPIS
ncbi:MAG: sel1 repeat family protein [Alphaproteobacteria bacterium]|nr:sel1 repeat family protein [Alphaproteobacteria bacterium]